MGAPKIYSRAEPSVLGHHHSSPRVFHLRAHLYSDFEEIPPNLVPASCSLGWLSSGCCHPGKWSCSVHEMENLACSKAPLIVCWLFSTSWKQSKSNFCMWMSWGFFLLREFIAFWEKKKEKSYFFLTCALAQFECVSLFHNCVSVPFTDFGLSNCAGILGYSDPFSTQCGSPAYAAPELLARKKYGPKIDVWSM